MNHHLIQYGRLASVGAFCGDGDPLRRGSQVVVRSPRGLELGTVLDELQDRFVGHVDSASGGEWLREASDDDRREAKCAEELSSAIVAAASEADVPVSFLDCEVTLDRTRAELHVLPWGECDLDGLLVDLSLRFGVVLKLLDLGREPAMKDPPEPTSNCGSGGCGSTGGGCGSGGGCSTGSCSKGHVKSAEELTAYFAGLRSQMEASLAR